MLLRNKILASACWQEKKKIAVQHNTGNNNDIKNNLKWSLMEHAREFCQHTSLHGLQYVGEAGIHVLERCVFVNNVFEIFILPP
jgi:hypothetical protein